MLRTIAFAAGSIALFGFLANRLYFKGSTCKSYKRIDGKVVIITGCNTGIGYETALDLAKRGGTIVMACRDLKKANEAAKQIISQSNNQNVLTEQCDLSDLKSIKNFVDRFRSRFDRLDILINNAGILPLEYTKTKDNFESAFGVHHLGHFYLTNLLFDLLKDSAPSRIVVLSSDSHEGVKMNWDDLNFEKKFYSWTNYKQSKLANVLFALEFSNRYGEYGTVGNSGVTAVSLNPGFVRTEIFRDLRKGYGFYSMAIFFTLPFFYMITKSCKEGAQTTLHCALDDSVPEFNGQYFDDCQVHPTSPEGRDLASGKKLWEISEKMVGLRFNV